MKAKVLITGGSEGIGLGLATRFLAADGEVLVTGRDPAKLALTPFKTIVSDAGDPIQREALANYIRETMPDINVVINNAGIQRRIGLAVDKAPWPERQEEIDVLLAGPIHLNHLLIPLMLASGKPGLIVNVTSGGAYIPQVFAPVYSACKAALHSYTMTLRHALAGTLIRVVELIPPAVQTGLTKDMPHGADIDAFCDAVFARLMDESRTDVGFGPTEGLTPELSGKPVSTFFEAGAARFPVQTY